MSHLLMAYAQSRQHDVVLFPAPICPVSAIVTRQKKHTPAEVLLEFGRVSL